MDWKDIYFDRLDECEAMPPVALAVVPRAPKNVALLSTLAQDHQLTVKQLQQIIERDAELTSQVLRQVNSCSTGLKVRIHTVARAIGLLGERRCKMLVLSAMLQSSLRSALGVPELTEDYLTDCLERAIFARLTAEALNVDPDASYISSLLQDLLLPTLRSSFADDYLPLSSTPIRIEDFERVTFGWTHASLTARVLRDWNLPDTVVASVLFSHSPDVLLPDSPLHCDTLIPTAAAALLPDVYNQEPTGVMQLVQLQESLPEFNVLTIAMQVDDELDQLPFTRSKREPLSDRLARIAFQQVEKSRQETNWIGQRIGNYVVESQIGQGGMGVVYLAQHATLQRRAAIKLMRKRHLDAESLERFEVEARLTSGLRSRHTIEVYDYGATHNGVLYYVMEYLDGLGLADVVERFGPQPDARVIHILRQVCESLAEAHELGLIHRDIKPENIFLSHGDWTPDFVKVLDFGLVKSIQPDGDGDHKAPPVCGTPLFLSPEAILTPHRVDGRADLYSLGLVAYYLLSGRFAIDGQDAKQVLLSQISRLPARLSSVVSHPIDPGLEALVMQCLEKSPDDRPRSAAALADVLGALQHIPRWTPESANRWWQRVSSDPMFNRTASPAAADDAAAAATHVGMSMLMSSALF
ncbi:MAG: protein kinase domain-containing protein [Planctomycetaceae bacterium]